MAQIYRAFKGTNHEYRMLHRWVAKNLGTPDLCTNCGNTEPKPRRYQWANLSGEYKRDLSDWRRLCVSCHMKLFDHGRWLRKTHCFKGHAFVEGNIYISPKRGQRACIACRREYAKEYREKQRV